MADGCLLTLDVGNTQTVVGLYDEFAATLNGFLSFARISFAELTGVAVCSGVPRVQAMLRTLTDRYLDFAPVVIGPGITTGMPIKYDNPREVGADRIANAIAAYELYGGPAVIVDFGTGNNFDTVSASGEFLGGAIAPGIEVSMEALIGKASALTSIELIEPRSVIGKSTVESLLSGAAYGFAASVDGMVDRFQDELGGGAVVVATGGLAGRVATECKAIDRVEPFLTLEGLRMIFEKNRPISEAQQKGRPT